MWIWNRVLGRYIAPGNIIRISSALKLAGRRQASGVPCDADRSMAIIASLALLVQNLRKLGRKDAEKIIPPILF